MFLRRLFNPDRKIFWVFVDLVVVIIGVYLAFLLQSSTESKRLNKEQDRILTALKYEVETFRYKMFQASLGAEGKVAEMKKTIANDSYSSFLGIRFIEPQHDYQTIQYAINHNNTEVIDFDLFNVLQSFLVEVKKLEHTERLITEVSLQYRSLPHALDSTSTKYKLLNGKNFDNFKRLLIFNTDRLNISKRIVEASKKTLALLNQRLGAIKTKQIEEQIILENLHLVDNQEEAIQLAKRFFPNFTDSEVKQLYTKAHSKVN